MRDHDDGDLSLQPLKVRDQASTRTRIVNARGVYVGRATNVIKA